ncbi:hypothetical protein HK098_004435 [Nowakowskiella sp. JEL0407]|nr:hypothetical protein HK098_004435 [Nowakowskiella sp. JEL0407]
MYIYKKDAEFRTWLIEVKNISIEVLNPKAKKEYFEEYVEDYNTATFPDKKYYDLEKWEKSNPIHTTSAAATYSIKSDEEILRQQFKKKQVGVPSVQLTNEQLQELSRVNKERIEKDRLRKMGVKARDSLGVRYE